MVSGAWICLLSPLVSAGLITVGGTRLSRRASGYVATLSCFVAFGGALAAFIGLLGREGSQRQLVSTAWTWISGGSYRSGLEVLVDPLSVFMMLVVAGVGALIVGYSIGYMDGDDEERRYFAYMAVFVFSMLLLVQSGNLLLLLAGWGLVGLSSYLLIGFWHDRPSAIAAAKKAFVMNAIGDAPLALAFFLLIKKAGSLEFGILGGAYSSTVANLVALGLLGGAVAKSAQLPLQTWLPDAMEGPTPVIALIQVDIKRVIAYSTMSQIGYMFLGAGLGAYANGMFHLMTHAFFKALLFMAAGLVIHALAGEQDIRKMGGLRGLMPRTYWAFLVGALALVGLPPFAGFFSKDSILAAAMHDGWYGYLLWAGGLVGTFLTGLYTFRMLFVVFGGEPSPFVREHLIRPRRRGEAHHGEGPFSMTSTVAILAFLSLIGGWIQFAPLWTPITHWLDVVAPTLPHAEATSWQEGISSAPAVGLGLAGLVTAWLVYSRRKPAPPRLAFAQRVLEHKFYFDEAYDLVFYRPAVGVARLFGRIVEPFAVRGSITGLARGTRDVARGVSEAQTGLLRTYALAIASGLLVLVVVFISVK